MANPNMTVKPIVMLLGLINSQNNLHLTEKDVAMKPPAVIANPVTENVTVDGTEVPVTRNTSIEIDILTDEVKDDFVTFTYERINLATIFSAITPVIKEVDIKATGTVTLAEVIAEVLRKYKVLTTDTDFDYTITQNQIVLTAKPVNVAFIGTVNITVEQSLLTRVANVELNGFELPTANSDVQDVSARIAATGELVK